MKDKLDSLSREIQSYRSSYVRAKYISERFDLKLNTVYKMAYRNQIPSHRVNGRLRFVLSEVAETILNRRS